MAKSAALRRNLGIDRTAHGKRTSGAAKRPGRAPRESVSASGSQDVTLAAAQRIVISAADELTIKVGSSAIVMKKNGDIEIKGTRITIAGSSEIRLKSVKIQQN